MYTDGSCHNATSSKGGWGVIQIEPEVKAWYGGSYENTTSARQEIRAIVKALSKCEAGDEVIIYSDSQYCVNTLAKGWIYKWEQQGFINTMNADLWKEFFVRFKMLHRKVRLEWIRGHNGNEFNEIADRLACKGGKKEEIIKDVKYQRTKYGRITYS